MTAWLLEKADELEPGLFEYGDEYEFGFDDDTVVYVLDADTEAVVGPFEPLAVGDETPGTNENGTRARLRPVEDELSRVTDQEILEMVEGPKLSQPIAEAINQAPDTVSATTFFGERDTLPNEEGANSSQSSVSEEPTERESPSLQSVFAKQSGQENADFSGNSVTGSKTLTETSLRGSTLSDTTLREVTFNNVNLRDVDFRGADLRQVTFTGFETQLGGADFTGARLDGATFDVDVSECKFTEAQIRDGDFREATLEGADFSRARLKRAKFNGTVPERATFDEAVLQDIKTSGARFEKTSFVGADLYNTTFAQTEFVDVDFTDADLREVRFDACTLEDVVYVDSKLVSVSLIDHETQNLNFSRADLTEATLDGSSFDGGRFDGARMTDASLTGCDLSGVSLSDIRADGATFDSADLEYATLAQGDLTDATFNDARLYACQLANVRVGTGRPFEDIYGYLGTRTGTEADGMQDVNPGGTDETDRSPAMKAASVYRSLEEVYRDNSRTEESLRYHRLRKDATIRVSREEGRLTPVLYDGFLKWTTGHGTSLKPLFLWASALVLAGAFVHVIFGTVEHATLGRLGIESSGVGAMVSFSQALLFSTLSFTGLGFGRFTPVGTLGEAIAVTQTACGILFFGLLVFVLSTRASR